ncbi:hypothetical protein ACS0TY_036649 [Phlomoides rotata]
MIGFMRAKSIISPALGDIATLRKQFKAIIDSLYPACTKPYPITGEPFRAQAIIANPPAFGQFFRDLLLPPSHFNYLFRDELHFSICTNL